MRSPAPGRCRGYRRRMPRVVDVRGSGSTPAGTFTDVVAADGTIAKVPSTPDDPARRSRGRRRARSAGRGPRRCAHGTTVATNALLERRGAAVALVTTERPRRRHRDRPPGPAVALRPVRPTGREPLVPRGLAVRGAAAAWPPTAPSSNRSTRARCPRCPTAPRRWPSACCTPTSTRPTSRRSAPALRGRGLDVTCSHEVSPEFREYERTVTTVVNAYLRPALPRLPRSGSADWPTRCW